MACGSFTSDSFTSARSIIVAISNVPAIADAGASRCAPQWLHATRPKTEDQNVLPILRSKMPPIIPNAQEEHTLLHVRWRIPQRTQNAFHYPSEIAINVRIPESKNSKTLRLQKGVANLIRSSTLRHSVLTTVCFDNELRSERNEVDDVTADGCLSSEMKAEGFQVAQPHPQSDFLRRQTFAKCAGIFICQGSPSWEASSHVIGSLPALVYPSPVWGGIKRRGCRAITR